MARPARCAIMSKTSATSSIGPRPGASSSVLPIANTIARYDNAFVIEVE